LKILPIHRNFIIINQGIIATAFNFFINICIAWLLYRNIDQVPLWGASSIAIDTLLTAFVLTLLSYYFIALSVWWTMKMKWLPVIDEYPKAGIISTMIKLPILVQGIVFGILAAVLLGFPVVMWFFLTGTQSISYESFRWYKAIFGAALSLIVSPPIALLILMDFSKRKKLIR
jgi:hypothetical protein